MAHTVRVAYRLSREMMCHVSPYVGMDIDHSVGVGYMSGYVDCSATGSICGYGSQCRSVLFVDL